MKHSGNRRTKAASVALKVVSATLSVIVALAALSSLSPIYRFAKPSPFRGPDIFNPYQAVSQAGDAGRDRWKRANFHTHTRMHTLINECDFWPAQVDSAYRRFGYGIVAFSNHNHLTRHPYDSTLQINVYEHGYNLFKFHKLVFGSSRVNRFDHLFPFLVSQRQFQLDLLGRDADFIQINHPYRTLMGGGYGLDKLTGYSLMELDSGIGVGQEYWDCALSTGHYSFGTAGDDLHFPDRSDRIAVRFNMLFCDGAGYDDVKECLSRGSFYAVRVPDWGNGDWEEKIRRNKTVPRICDIGVRGDTLYVELSENAALITVTGQGHSTLAEVSGNSRLDYVLGENDPYARFTVCFEDGTVLYSNPFARYDKRVSPTPFGIAEHSVDLPLTLLYNAFLLLVAAGCVWGMIKLRPRRGGRASTSWGP